MDADAAVPVPGAVPGLGAVQMAGAVPGAGAGQAQPGANLALLQQIMGLQVQGVQPAWNQVVAGLVAAGIQMPAPAIPPLVLAPAAPAVANAAAVDDDDTEEVSHANSPKPLPPGVAFVFDYP